MRTTSLLLAFLAVACAVFAVWGLGTVAGRHAFDEMAGIVPLASGAFSVLLALCALLAWWRHARLRMVKGVRAEA